MIESTSKSGRMRKFVPQPHGYVERYGNFTLTRRDLEILDVVHGYRYLEARHIRALVEGSGQQITRRLQGLFHNAYLGRYARRERMRTDLDPGELRPLMRVAPDAYFVLCQGDQVRHFFLEADRSTEEHRRLVNKYVGYWWYLQHGRPANARGGRPRVNVLLLTTGESRLVNMIEALRQMPKPTRADHGGKGSFRFCLDRDVALDDPFWIFKPVWRTVADSIDARKLPLLAPPLHDG